MATTYLIIVSVLALAIGIPLLLKFKNLKLLKTVTSLKRGTKSERKLILTLLENGTPSQAIFHDLILEKRNGKTSQIDLVVPTKEGIIVFEVKDYSGWIFGNCTHTRWTQVLAYGNVKHRFYNPVKQNANHISALKNQSIQFKNIPYFSIIVFYGDSEIKEIDYVPNGTFLVKPTRIIEVLNLIKKQNKPAAYTDKKEIVRVLKNAVKIGENVENQEKHIENINDTLGKDRIFE
ncbi:MAG: nuclease-related domain-containing protein [Bacteroidota bacterium]